MNCVLARSRPVLPPPGRAATRARARRASAVWARRGALAVGMWAAVGLGSAACVFSAPPLLPGEELDGRARALAVLEGRGGQAPANLGVMGAAPEGEAEPAAAETDATTGEPAPDDGVAIGFQVGELAPAGLDRAALVQFATVQGDPKQGVFTLDEALAGLPRPKGDAQLWAIFEVTDRGAMQCRLFFEAAPDTVANFVGLARGIRPFRPPAVTPNVEDPASDWTTAPYYDGTTFHRVIPGFMIQGGDPSATGRGNPGFVVPDEIRSDLGHDVGGVLSMANRGPNTAGSQFFITLAPATNLDGSYTIFGRCTEDSVAVADNIAMVPRNADDKPDEPEVLERIRFEWR